MRVDGLRLRRTPLDDHRVDVRQTVERGVILPQLRARDVEVGVESLQLLREECCALRVLLGLLLQLRLEGGRGVAQLGVAVLGGGRRLPHALSEPQRLLLE